MRTNKTTLVTKRFLEAVKEIIRRNEKSGGKIIDYQSFAESVGDTPQNFQKVRTQGQMVGRDMMIESIHKYRINPTWLILGEGEMFLKEDINGRLEAIERRLAKLEKK